MSSLASSTSSSGTLNISPAMVTLAHLGSCEKSSRFSEFGQLRAKQTFLPLLRKGCASHLWIKIHAFAFHLCFTQIKGCLWVCLHHKGSSCCTSTCKCWFHSALVKLSEGIIDASVALGAVCWLYLQIHCCLIKVGQIEEDSASWPVTRAITDGDCISAVGTLLWARKSECIIVEAFYSSDTTGLSGGKAFKQKSNEHRCLPCIKWLTLLRTDWTAPIGKAGKRCALSRDGSPITDMDQPPCQSRMLGRQGPVLWFCQLDCLQVWGGADAHRQDHAQSSFMEMRVVSPGYGSSAFKLIRVCKTTLRSSDL